MSNEFMERLVALQCDYHAGCRMLDQKLQDDLIALSGKDLAVAMEAGIPSGITLEFLEGSDYSIWLGDQQEQDFGPRPRIPEPGEVSQEYAAWCAKADRSLQRILTKRYVFDIAEELKVPMVFEELELGVRSFGRQLEGYGKLDCADPITRVTVLEGPLLYVERDTYQLSMFAYALFYRHPSKEPQEA